MICEQPWRDFGKQDCMNIQLELELGCSRYVARFGGVETSQGSEGTPHKVNCPVDSLKYLPFLRDISLPFWSLSIALCAVFLLSTILLKLRAFADAGTCATYTGCSDEQVRGGGECL
ncbi:hypothetical protein POTOM_036949 [Populus tomentosa]|uniref:Uncharacterized protein n=1 Tax=Populus tomentosa TaxID=118781 RepID=A0A8X7Z3T9_POPTO|nr:hypothetical protein POTOM_036949 [Populus tomentosa]